MAKMSRLKAVLTVLEDGINNIDEGVKFVSQLVEGYSDETIEKEFNYIINGLRKTDLNLSKTVLKYRLIEDKKNNSVKIDKLPKEAFKEISEDKKKFMSMKRKQKSKSDVSIYQNEEEYAEQNLIIQQIIKIRDLVGYWVKTDDDVIKSLRSHNIEQLTKHRDKLLEKNPAFKSKIEEIIKDK